MKMQLRVISSEKIILSVECEVISLMSITGMLEIMYGYEPMLIQLKKGDIIYDKEHKIHVKSGFARIANNLCEIAVEI
jgi:F0F1-type ATP synthase epsilon subunit